MWCFVLLIFSFSTTCEIGLRLDWRNGDKETSRQLVRLDLQMFGVGEH